MRSFKLPTATWEKWWTAYSWSWPTLRLKITSLKRESGSWREIQSLKSLLIKTLNLVYIFLNTRGGFLVNGGSWGGFLVKRGSWAPLGPSFWLENLPLQSTEFYKKLSSFFTTFVPNYLASKSWAKVGRQEIALNSLKTRNRPLMNKKLFTYFFYNQGPVL